MTNTVKAKLRVIRTILANDTFDKTSGLCQRLEARLLQLSLEDLSDLSLIIDYKVMGAVANAGADSCR